MPGEAVLQHRGLSARRPGAHPRRALGESRLIYEDDGLAAFNGVFFSAGQRRCFHWRMARPVGRWQEKPSALSNRHTWTSLYWCPKRWLIKVLTRGKVHSSVGNPVANAPCLSRRTSSRRSTVPNPGGRPTSLALSAERPSASSLAAQVDTVWRLTPTCRATSAGVPHWSTGVPPAGGGVAGLSDRVSSLAPAVIFAHEL